MTSARANTHKVAQTHIQKYAKILKIFSHNYVYTYVNIQHTDIDKMLRQVNRELAAAKSVSV